MRARPPSFGRGSRVIANWVSLADPLALSELMAGTPSAFAGPPCASNVKAAGESSPARLTSVRLQSPGARREISAAKSCSRSARNRPVAEVESRPSAPSTSSEAPSKPATLKRLRATFGPVLVRFTSSEPLSISVSPTRAICSEPALNESERSRSPIDFAAARLGSASTSSESLARSTSRRPASAPAGALKASAPVRAVRSSVSLRLRPENPAAETSTAPESDALR